MTLLSPRLLALAGGLSLGAPALAQVEYEFFLVDAWNTSYSLREAYVTEINAANVASGHGTNFSGQSPGFLWTEATGKTPLASTAPKGLNIHKVIVDNNYILDGGSNTSITLPPPAGYSVPQLRDINDHGLVVGRAWVGGNCSLVTCYSTYLWDEANGARTLAGVPNARDLVRLNNAGQLLGHIAAATFERTEAFIYDLNTQTWVNLGEGLPPHWLAGHPITSAFDISESGSAVGIAHWGQEAPQAFLWKQGGVRVLLPGLGSGEVDRVYPGGVNSSNVVVGRAANAPTSSTEFAFHAFIFDEVKGMRDLNSLATLPPNFILDEASKINDNGWIVGYGHFGPGWGTSRGFVLKPISQTPACYANCDQSTTAPILNVADFSCFLTKFAAGDSYANCDQSTTAPVLNVADFSCFLTNFAAGCR